MVMTVGEYEGYANFRQRHIAISFILNCSKYCSGSKSIMKSGAQPTVLSYSVTLRHNALVNPIQQFTEQSQGRRWGIQAGGARPNFPEKGCGRGEIFRIRAWHTLQLMTRDELKVITLERCHVFLFINERNN